MGDGAVIFMTDSVESGDQRIGITYPGQESPYGLWGALGTKNTREQIEAQLNQ
jgi:hypothetical protein